MGTAVRQGKVKPDQKILDKCWRDYERDGGHYQDAHKLIRDGLREAIDEVKTKRKTTRP